MSTISHSQDFTMAQPIEALFPLFSAEGEKLWVPGWDYENIMDKKELHEDYIFLTKTHDHAAAQAIWLVKRYEPARHFVQFYKVEPQEKVGIITVKCTELGSSQTQVTVTYQYTGLSPKGETFIQDFTQEAYASFIGEWKQLLNAYFLAKK